MREIHLEIAGLGIIMYSPSSAAHISEGDDYLHPHYWEPSDVEEHIQAGTIVGFATGTPGSFILRILKGYPDRARLESADFKLRLGLRSDGTVVFRDLYDLREWTTEPPSNEQLMYHSPGTYHITLCSDMPPGGELGDDQVVEVYLQPLTKFPDLARIGVPSLC